MACSCCIQVAGRSAKGRVCPREEDLTKQISVFTIFSYFVERFSFIITFLFNLNTREL